MATEEVSELAAVGKDVDGQKLAALGSFRAGALSADALEAEVARLDRVTDAAAARLGLGNAPLSGEVPAKK